MEGGGKGGGFGNHPGVVFIGFAASLIGILSFLTGRHDLSEFLALGHTESRESESRPDSSVASQTAIDSSGTPALPQATSEDIGNSLASWRVDSFGSHIENVRWHLVSDSSIVEAIGGNEFGGGNSVAYMPTVKMENGIVSGLVKVQSVFNAGHHSGLVARYRDVGNFYELFLNKPSSVIALNCWLNGKEVRLRMADLPEAWFESWIRLRLELKGAELRAYANGRMCFVVRDEVHSDGNMGLVNMGGVTQFRGINFIRLSSERAPN